MLPFIARWTNFVFFVGNGVGRYSLWHNGDIPPPSPTFLPWVARMHANRRLCFLILVWFAGTSSPAWCQSTALHFESKVRQVLKIHCWHCHGEEAKIEGGLDLRLVRSMAQGGDSGPAVVPGDSDASLLIEKIESGEMPPSGKGLTAAEKQVIRQWIDQGAQVARPEPEQMDNHSLWTIEEQSHWSLQPIVRPQTPQTRHPELVRNAVDAFVLDRLEQQGLTISPEADQLTLLRRVTFDLTGLPPSQQDIEDFQNDKRPDAYEHWVDRLLASPAYGERWARHWLDTAGYADSDGYNELDRERPWTFRYRDYVIRSLNADKPFDQFVVEQLAGDELVEPPYVDLSDEAVEKLTATGFLRMAPDGTGQGEPDPVLARNDVIAETVKVATSTMLGLTVGCAQCHNHRYDPISQLDYFRIRSLFEPALDTQHWRDRPTRLISTWQSTERELAAKVDAQLAEIEGRRVAELDQLVSQVFEQEVAKLPADKQSLARLARDTGADKRSPEQLAILKEFPSLNVDRGSVYLYEPTRMQEFNKKYEALVVEAKAARPSESFIDAFTEVPGQIPPTHLLARGDPKQPRELVDPGDLSVLKSTANIPVDDPAIPTSGRRLAFARYLTQGNHPLFNRVMVNRIWMHHFGRGIVNTPSDFGLLGDRPSHPELLDWLSDEWVRSGWSVKHLHRMIVTSAIYRQQSSRRSELEAMDPDNRLLGRMNIRRLEAEAIRDSMIAVSGLANSTMYGPAETVNPDDVGQVIIGTAVRDGNGILVASFVHSPQQYRRTIYTQVRRSMPLGVLEPFDLPTLAPNCDRRVTSTVAPQSLLMMNNRQTVMLSERFAENLVREYPTSLERRVADAWLRSLGRPATPDEISAGLNLVQSQLQWIQERDQKIASGAAPADSKPTDLVPEAEALALLCQAIFSANPFLYID